MNDTTSKETFARLAATDLKNRLCWKCARLGEMNGAMPWDCPGFRVTQQGVKALSCKGYCRVPDDADVRIARALAADRPYCGSCKDAVMCAQRQVRRARGERSRKAFSFFEPVVNVSGHVKPCYVPAEEYKETYREFRK